VIIANIKICAMVAFNVFMNNRWFKGEIDMKDWEIEEIHRMYEFLRNYLNEAKKLIYELNHPTSINRICSICEKLNLENADYCCYCGSSLIITRIRQQDKSPVNATE